jgi:hypothetical protein
LVGETPGAAKGTDDGAGVVAKGLWALVEPFEADVGEIVAEVPLVVPGLGVEEDADEEVVTTGVGGVGGAEVVGEVEGVEFALCAEEVDEPAVGGRVADDAPFRVTGFILQLFTS